MRHIHEKPGVLLFVLPFAAPASHKHTAKLLHCLAPVCGHIEVLGDSRLDVAKYPPHVRRYSRIPTLHYLNSIRPMPLSAVLWMFKLAWVLLYACWAVVATRRKADVVICFQGIYYAPVFLVARLLGKQTLFFEPGNDLENAEASYGKSLLARLFLGIMRLMRGSTRILAHICAIESLRLVERMGIEAQAEKVRNGNLYVDTHYYRITTPLEEREPVVGFVGRLIPGKGIMPLLEAAAQLHGTGVRFKIVGDGPQRDEIEKALKRPELSHVALQGWADESSVVELLNSFGLLVLPTLAEGLPNIVLEAMACGTPVLATPVGAIPDLIEHTITGFILPNREPETIARSILEALNHPELTRIVEQSRQYVACHFSPSASSAKWALILGELTHRSADATQPQLAGRRGS